MNTEEITKPTVTVTYCATEPDAARFAFQDKAKELPLFALDFIRITGEQAQYSVRAKSADDARRLTRQTHQVKRITRCVQLNHHKKHGQRY